MYKRQNNDLDITKQEDDNFDCNLKSTKKNFVVLIKYDLIDNYIRNQLQNPIYRVAMLPK